MLNDIKRRPRAELLADHLQSLMQIRLTGSTVADLANLTLYPLKVKTDVKTRGRTLKHAAAQLSLVTSQG